MVEILKRGVPPEERKYTISCHECQTQFRFLRSEAKYNSDQREGSYLEILCPVCKKSCTVAVKLYDRVAGEYSAWDR